MTSIGEERKRERERASFAAMDYSYFCWFCSKEFLPLGA